MVNVDLQFLHSLSMFAQHRIQKSAVLLRFDQRHQCVDRLANIAPEAEIQLASLAQVIHPDINLCDLGFCRKKLVVREISAH